MGLSDDSHGKHAVGLNYSRLAEYLKASGVTEIYSLVEGEGGLSGRAVKPAVVGGNWWSDPFWERLPQ